MTRMTPMKIMTVAMNLSSSTERTSSLLMKNLITNDLIDADFAASAFVDNSHTTGDVPSWSVLTLNSPTCGIIWKRSTSSNPL
jgi:hypothetical protein